MKKITLPAKRVRSEYLGIRLEPELLMFVSDMANDLKRSKSEVAREILLKFKSKYR